MSSKEQLAAANAQLEAAEQAVRDAKVAHRKEFAARLAELCNEYGLRIEYPVEIEEFSGTCRAEDFI